MVLQEKKKKCFKTARAASLGSWLQSQLLGWLPCSFSSLGTTPPLLSSKTTTFQLSGAAVYYQSEAWHSAFLSRDLGEQLAGILIRSNSPFLQRFVCLMSIDFWVLSSWTWFGNPITALQRTTGHSFPRYVLLKPLCQNSLSTSRFWHDTQALQSDW